MSVLETLLATAKQNPSSLSALFQQPLKKVSVDLEICSTTMKKICRDLGFGRWPYRKVASLIKGIEDRQRASPTDDDAKSLEMLTTQLDMLLNIPMHIEVKFWDAVRRVQAAKLRGRVHVSDPTSSITHYTPSPRLEPCSSELTTTSSSSALGASQSVVPRLESPYLDSVVSSSPVTPSSNTSSVLSLISDPNEPTSVLSSTAPTSKRFCLPNTLHALEGARAASHALGGAREASRSFGRAQTLGMPQTLDAARSVLPSLGAGHDAPQLREAARGVSLPSEGSRHMSLPFEAARGASLPYKGTRILPLPYERAWGASPPDEGAHASTSGSARDRIRGAATATAESPLSEAERGSHDALHDTQPGRAWGKSAPVRDSDGLERAGASTGADARRRAWRKDDEGTSVISSEPSQQRGGGVDAQRHSWQARGVDAARSTGWWKGQCDSRGEWGLLGTPGGAARPSHAWYEARSETSSLSLVGARELDESASLGRSIKHTTLSTEWVGPRWRVPAEARVEGSLSSRGRSPEKTEGWMDSEGRGPEKTEGWMDSGPEKTEGWMDSGTEKTEGSMHLEGLKRTEGSVDAKGRQEGATLPSISYLLNS